MKFLEAQTVIKKENIYSIYEKKYNFIIDSLLK